MNASQWMSSQLTNGLPVTLPWREGGVVNVTILDVHYFKKMLCHHPPPLRAISRFVCVLARLSPMPTTVS